MYTKRYALTALAILVASFTTLPVWSDPADHIMSTPDQLEWKDIGSLPPGAQLAVIEGSMAKPAPFTVRLKFPANYKIPAHWHPVVERVTVISGEFYMGLGNKLDEDKGSALGPGGMMILQPEVRHFAWTEDDATIVQLNGIGPWGITYVNPDDDPRKK